MRTEELYARHGKTVAGLCRALLRDRAEAEDASQQVFLQAHRALLGGTDPREPAAWLATIARNECWGRIRSRMREPLATDEVDAVSLAPDPLAEAIRRADLRALWLAIDALPRPQRDALLLREFGGLSYDELAEALAVSGSAVESLLFRARQRLRTQLRAVYASLSGAPFLEQLARVFAGGSAPVAAKVVALGVGAAAVSSTAVVAPQLIERHTAPARPHRQAVHIAKKHVVRPPVALAVTPVPLVQPAAPSVVRVVARHDDEHRAVERPDAEQEHPSGGDDSTQPATQSPDEPTSEDQGHGGGATAHDQGSGGDGSGDGGAGGDHGGSDNSGDHGGDNGD